MADFKTHLALGVAAVNLKRKVVLDIREKLTAADGATEAEMNRSVKVGDFVLSRTNAPLVPMCLKLVQRGIPARVRGRDVGAGLTAIVHKAKAHTLDQVQAHLTAWAAKQMARAMPDEKKAALVERVTDQVSAIEALIEVSESVDDLLSKISAMFNDSNKTPCVMLSTVHRAKGLEAERVFILEKTFTISGAEEENIRYVAITRAKAHLTFVA